MITSIKEWEALAAIAGYGALLPAAATGQPSENSKVSPKMVGKVPSLYDRDGNVYGFKDWSGHIASQVQVKRWAAHGGYNICVVTGRPLPGNDSARLYALDVDSEDAEIQNIVYGLFAHPSAVRTRADSQRRLLLVAVEGTPITKRVLRLSDERGLLEFLGDGQQFIAAGRHPRGQMYEWLADPDFDPSPCLPDFVPVLTREEFDAWWTQLLGALPVLEESQARQRHDRDHNGEWCTDATADWLDANNWTIDTGADGRRYIRSPRVAMYTDGEQSDTSVCYFPAGSNGYERGHFVSLHASDADMSDDDWLDAFGIGVREEFPSEPEDTPSGEITARLKRDKKTGKVKGTPLMLYEALSDPQLCGYTFRYDTLTLETIVHDLSGQRVALNDSLPVRIMVDLEKDWGFEKVEKGNVTNALNLVAWENRYDAGQEWLSAQVWDGVPRVDTFFTDLWQMDNTPYARAVARYMWSAMAARVMDPGCKADMAVMLISQKQGKQKSSTLEALVPFYDWYGSLDFGQNSAERGKVMRGKVLLELEEMQGFSRREVTEIRTFLSVRRDTYRLAYDKYPTEAMRRCFFVATTNNVTPLRDDAGERRWLPMVVPDSFDAVEHNAVAHARAMCSQLWAEGLAMWEAGGIRWQEAEELAREEHAAFKEKDLVLEADILEWLDRESLDGTGKNRDELITADVIARGIFGSSSTNDHQILTRIGKTMKNMGWVKERRRGRNGLIWVYVLPS